MNRERYAIIAILMLLILSMEDFLIMNAFKFNWIEYKCKSRLHNKRGKI